MDMEEEIEINNKQLAICISHKLEIVKEDITIDIENRTLNEGLGIGYIHYIDQCLDILFNIKNK
jgi:hypothetical protein